MICSSSWDSANMILYISSRANLSMIDAATCGDHRDKSDSNPRSRQRNNEGPTA
jgi:hypothetical protein